MRTSTPVTRHERPRHDGKPIVSAAANPLKRLGLHDLLTVLRHVRRSQLTALAAMLANSIRRQGRDGMALLGLPALAAAVVSWRLLHRPLLAFRTVPGHNPPHDFTAGRAARWPHRW